MVDFAEHISKRELIEAHRVLDKYGVPTTRVFNEQSGPYLVEREITLTVSARIELLADFAGIHPVRP